ncbi:MAG: hypothetical protein ACRD3C_23270 [Vicinamibacterales bacterium]
MAWNSLAFLGHRLRCANPMLDLLGVRQKCAAVDWPARGEEIRLKRTGLFTELGGSSELFQQDAPRAARHQIGRQS